MPSTLKKDRSTQRIIEPNFFSNWGDLFFPTIANRLLLPASQMGWLKPNHVSVLSFLLYSSACFGAILWPDLRLWFAFLLPLSYILDCLDGQLARYTKQMSKLGDYLDKTLDVIKIFVINFSIGLIAYRETQDIIFIYLSFLSCFAFLFRYYIKLETMFGAINNDSDYLDKSRERRQSLYARLLKQKSAKKTLAGHLKWQWFRHRSFLALDEAEHVILGALAIGTGHATWWCWAFGIWQTIIALFRLAERGWQITRKPASLTYPLRK